MANKKNPYAINRIARDYSQCMTPDQATQRCRPGWRSANPQQEAQTRAIELLQASGEEVTLLTRKIAGDDIIDRLLPPVHSNYVSALPLNMVFVYDACKAPPIASGVDPRFSSNQSGILSGPLQEKNLDLQDRRASPWPMIPTVPGRQEALVVAKRPPEGLINYIYVGNKRQFSNLSIKLLTRLKSDNVIWEYSVGNGVWLPIPMISAESSPGASTLQESGRMVFDISFFPNWKTDYVNREPAYWTRARVDENTEGQAAAILLITEDIIQSTEVWAPGDDPTVFPNDRCVTIKVNGVIYNRVYDIHQLDYSKESFVLIRRDKLSKDCPLTMNDNEDCGMNPFDTCETDPLEHLSEIGNIDRYDTTRLRELAFLYNQINREKQKAAADTVVLLFTRNLRLDTAQITATYTTICPCTAYGRFQPIRNFEQPDDSICQACLGTEFVHGYDRYINPDSANGKILFSFPEAPFDMPNEEHGYGRTHELTTAWTAYTPRVYVRDLVVRYDEFGNETLRYVIDTRSDSRGRRGVLLHQDVTMKALDPAKIEYRIMVPNLPLAPNQAQIFQSLGLPVPIVPQLTPCEQDRLEKGIQDCLPKRNRNQE